MKQLSIKTVFKGFENTSFGYQVKTDQKRLQQILLNLLTNAVKFTEGGGKIHIIVKQITQPSCSFLRISVSDTGIGIKKEH